VVSSPFSSHAFALGVCTRRFVLCNSNDFYLLTDNVSRLFSISLHLLEKVHSCYKSPEGTFTPRQCLLHRWTGTRCSAGELLYNAEVSCFFPVDAW